MSSKLFGTSGIRGVANVEVTPLLAMRVGAAIASQLGGGVVAVGRDTRLTGEMLEAALAAGATSCGAEVKALGVLPTPAIAYLTKRLAADAGVSISASHNPPQYNGLKVFADGAAYSDGQQRRLERRVKRGEFRLSTWRSLGRVEEVEGRGLYVDAVAEAARLDRRWRVVCDLFNGATSTVASRVFDAAGCDALMVNAQPDGHFPSGDPEPTPYSLGRLGRLVEARGAEVGFGFDGDGDRMLPLDERGRVPAPDRVLAAYARHVIEEKGGGLVVTHVGASMAVDEAVRGAGGTVLRTRVGDVSIAEAVRERSAVFGGEPAGAWIHPDVHLCPDGLLSALRLLRALEEEGETLSGFLAGVPAYPILGAKVECPNRLKERAARLIRAGCREAFAAAKSASTVDGIRVDLEEGWVLMRPSGTEPAFRITAEARDAAVAEALLERGRRLVLMAVEGGR